MEHSFQQGMGALSITGTKNTEKHLNPNRRGKIYRV